MRDKMKKKMLLSFSIMDKSSGDAVAIFEKIKQLIPSNQLSYDFHRCHCIIYCPKKFYKSYKERWDDISNDIAIKAILLKAKLGKREE